MTLQEIAQYLNGELHGPADLQISGPGKIDAAHEGEITFLANLKYKHHLNDTKASAVIVDGEVKDERIDLPHIVVPDAYIGFVQVLRLFDQPQYTYFEGVSDRAWVADSAQIATSARVAPLAYIGPDVKIGERTVIYPGVVILKNVEIGDDCILYPNVSVREFCRIGNRVILQNGCVIGSDGFGFAPNKGEYLKIPQLGNVIIEDDVELGANTTIDRATTGSTVIKKGTKLDNLVQIAHNVVVGEHTVMAAQSGVAGSTTVGKHVTIGGQVGVAGHIQIGDESMIGAQAGVTKTLKEKGIYWGTPAIPITRQKRIDVAVRQLPELLKKIRFLEEEVQKLREKLAEK